MVILIQRDARREASMWIDTAGENNDVLELLAHAIMLTLYYKASTRIKIKLFLKIQLYSQKVINCVV